MMLAARGEAAMSRQRRMPGVPARTSSVENRRGRLLLLGRRAGFVRAISLTAPHRLAAGSAVAALGLGLGSLPQRQASLLGPHRTQPAGAADVKNGWSSPTDGSRLRFRFYKLGC